MKSRIERTSSSALGVMSTRYLLGTALLAQQFLEEFLRGSGLTCAHLRFRLVQHPGQIEQMYHPLVPGDVEQDRRRLSVLGDDHRPTALPHLLQDRLRLAGQFR